MSNQSFIANVNKVVQYLNDISELNLKMSTEDIKAVQELMQLDISMILTDLSKGLYNDNRFIGVNLLENYLDYSDTLSEEEKRILYLDSSKTPRYDSVTLVLDSGVSTKIMFTQDSIEYTLSTSEELYEFMFENSTVNSILNNTLFYLNPEEVGNTFIVSDSESLGSNLVSIILHSTTPTLVKENSLILSWSDSTSSLMYLVNYLGSMKELLINIDQLLSAPDEIQEMLNTVTVLHDEVVSLENSVRTKHADTVDIKNSIDFINMEVEANRDLVKTYRDESEQFKIDADNSATQAQQFMASANSSANSAELSSIQAENSKDTAITQAQIATDKANIASTAIEGVETAGQNAIDEINDTVNTLNNDLLDLIRQQGDEELAAIQEKGDETLLEVESWAVGSIGMRPEGSAKWWAEQAEDKIEGIDEKIEEVSNVVDNGIITINETVLNVTNNINNLEDSIIINIEKSGENSIKEARNWAVGGILEQPEGSAKYWASLAEQITTGGQNWANEDLSNLSSVGNSKFTNLDDKIEDNLVIINNNFNQINADINSNENSIEIVKQAIVELDGKITAEEDKVTTIINGGTGANTVENARTNLEIYSKSEVDGLISSADIADATEIVSGKVRFSTTDEYNTGTSETTVVNPKQIQTSISELESAIETVSNSIVDTSNLGIAGHNTNITAHLDIRQDIEDESNNARISAITASNSYTDTKFANIGNATTGLAGLIEIATQAEVTAGTDTNKAIVPSTLSQYVVPIKDDISSLETAIGDKMSNFLVGGDFPNPITISNDETIKFLPGSNIFISVEDNNGAILRFIVPDATTLEKGAVQLCDVISTYNPSTLQATTESAVVAYSANKTLSNITSVSSTFQNLLDNYFATRTLGNITSLSQSFITLLQNNGITGNLTSVEFDVSTQWVSPIDGTIFIYLVHGSGGGGGGVSTRDHASYLIPGSGGRGGGILGKGTESEYYYGSPAGPSVGYEGASYPSSLGGVGGAGGRLFAYANVTKNSVYSIVVGAGGTAGTNGEYTIGAYSTGTDGGDGGESYISLIADFRESLADNIISIVPPELAKFFEGYEGGSGGGLSPNLPTIEPTVGSNGKIIIFYNE